MDKKLEEKLKDEQHYKTIKVDDFEFEEEASEEEEVSLVPLEEIRATGMLEQYLQAWQEFQLVTKETIAEASVEEALELETFGEAVAFYVKQINKLTDEERSGYDFTAIMTTYKNLMDVTENAFSLEKYDFDQEADVVGLPSVDAIIAQGELEQFLNFCMRMDPVTELELDNWYATGQLELMEMTFETIKYNVDQLARLTDAQKAGYDFTTLYTSYDTITTFMANKKGKN